MISDSDDKFTRAVWMAAAFLGGILASKLSRRWA
jgi:hypothetical protein